MPYPASLIAYAFVNKGIEEGKFVTQMKLQKMVFFAHGYHLAKYNESLINEEFEAWKFGPVIPKIYNDFKLYGSSPIVDADHLTTGKTFRILNLDEKAKDSIDYTWALTKNLTASQLSTWSHAKNSPWDIAYDPQKLSVKIPNESIKDYFKDILSISA